MIVDTQIPLRATFDLAAGKYWLVCLFDEEESRYSSKSGMNEGMTASGMPREWY